MAESVDATVSNTVGAILPGSIPGPGTLFEDSHRGNPLFISVDRAINWFNLYNQHLLSNLCSDVVF